MKNSGKIAVLAGVTLLLLGLSACSTEHLRKKSNRLPRIKEQPQDLVVESNAPASFEVIAKGQNLTYQWLFNDVPMVDSATIYGSQTNRLVISHARMENVGFYSCQIYEADPGITRTRSASLGIAAAGGTPTTNPMPIPSPTQNACGSFCGWVNFRGPYKPATGSTSGLLSVSLPSGGLAQTKYQVMWFDNTGRSGCTANLSGSNTEKTFRCVTSCYYAFTVYFVGACPATGTPVTLFVNWR